MKDIKKLVEYLKCKYDMMDIKIHDGEYFQCITIKYEHNLPDTIIEDICNSVDVKSWTIWGIGIGEIGLQIIINKDDLRRK